MNTQNKQKLYTSPEVKVIEVKARKVICDSSSSSNGQLGSSSWEDGSWEENS